MRASWRRLVFSLVVILALVAVSPAAAGRQWCRKDPAFLVSGTEVNVYVAVPEDKQKYVNGPLKILLYVPTNIAAKVTFVDEGFNGHGEEVMIIPSKELQKSRDHVRILVRATVPASTNAVPVQLTIVPAKGKSALALGKANTIVAVGTTIARTR
jgi:hypothetical protein